MSLPSKKSEMSSLPDYIREIRRNRYMATSNAVTRVAKVESSMEEESLEEVLVRVAIYERDEKLAIELGNATAVDIQDELKINHLSSPNQADDLRMPIPSVVERLIDPFDMPMLHLFPTATTRAVELSWLLPNRAATKFWQCVHCSSINLVENDAFCMFCHDSR